MRVKPIYFVPDDVEFLFIDLFRIGGIILTNEFWSSLNSIHTDTYEILNGIIPPVILTNYC